MVSKKLINRHLKNHISLGDGERQARKDGTDIERNETPQAKTPTSQEGPICPLGMWAATWRRRMAALREALLPLRSLDDEAIAPPPYLITLFFM